MIFLDNVSEQLIYDSVYHAIRTVLIDDNHYQIDQYLEMISDCKIQYPRVYAAADLAHHYVWFKRTYANKYVTTETLYLCRHRARKFIFKANERPLDRLFYRVICEEIDRREEAQKETRLRLSAR